MYGVDFCKSFTVVSSKLNYNGSKEDQDGVKSFVASNVMVITPLALEIHCGLVKPLAVAEVIVIVLQRAF